MSRTRFNNALAIFASCVTLVAFLPTIAQACRCDEPEFHFRGDRTDNAALEAYSENWYLDAARDLLSKRNVHVYVGSFGKAEKIDRVPGRKPFEPLDLKGILEVAEVWRGRPLPWLTVYGTSDGASSCSIPMSVGSHGWVYVLEDEDGGLVLPNQCIYRIFANAFIDKKVARKELLGRDGPIVAFSSYWGRN